MKANAGARPWTWIVLCFSMGCASGGAWKPLAVKDAENFHGVLFLQVDPIPWLTDDDELVVQANFNPPDHPSMKIEYPGHYQLQDTGSGLEPVVAVNGALMLMGYNDKHPGLLELPLGPSDIYAFFNNSKEWKIRPNDP